MEVILRRASRLVVIDPEGRVLLFRIREPRTGLPFWLTPGGGLEEGETHLEAAGRELREETGLRDVDIGGALWRGRRPFYFRGRDYDQEEVFFMVRVSPFEPDLGGAEDYEMDLEHRWWTLEELESTGETVLPPGLGGLLRRVLAAGPPAEALTLHE